LQQNTQIDYLKLKNPGDKMKSFLDILGFNMLFDYDSRKVDLFIDDAAGLVIDTVYVEDSSQPFETGIQHPNFNDGKWIIVELYSTEEDAQTGHNKWVKLMTSQLPDELVDVSDSDAASLADEFCPNESHIHKRQQ
jgi:hypothetical protein